MMLNSTSMRSPRRVFCLLKFGCGSELVFLLGPLTWGGHVFYSNHQCWGFSSFELQPNVAKVLKVWALLWFNGFCWNLVTCWYHLITPGVYVRQILTGHKTCLVIGLYMLPTPILPDPERDPCGKKPIWHKFTSLNQQLPSFNLHIILHQKMRTQISNLSNWSRSWNPPVLNPFT